MASRGPDGSVRLLFHFSWRQRLVSLGALATVLMLVFPTFVQQAIRQGTSAMVDDVNAIIFRAVEVFEDAEDQPEMVRIADERGTVCK